MKILNPMALAITLALTTTSVLAMDKDIKINNKTENGRPAFVTGKLGVSAPGQQISALKKILKEQKNYGSNGNENFKIKREWTDKLGKGHSQVSQTINGLDVYGTSMTIHTDKVTGINSVGENVSNIYALSGQLAINGESQKSVNVHKGNGKSRKAAKKLASELGKIEGKPELAYIYLPLTDETKLAWKIRVTWNRAGNDFGDDILFFDANNDNSLLTRHPQMHQAKNWQTDHLNYIDEGTVGPSTPRGTLLCANTQSCNEASAQRAHDGASSVYDFYQARFGRDSINDSDMTVVSGVHVGVDYNNAFWYNDRMWYGDGDGSQFNDLTLAHDVIGHELTHGVTEYTASLVYANASGALNEAWSDILGVASESYMKGNTQPDWKLGEEVMASGGALRYMNNPTQDGYSTDWYPDRISFVSNPNGSNDNGGVHGNSGIANLAFQLVNDGGTHPRGKSTVVVPSIGLAKAEQIFYRALVTYMGSGTNFSGARTATSQAATDLYGASEATAVETAWCAVGVGACPTPPVGDGDGELDNGVAVTGLSASTNQELTYTMVVPAGSTDINFTMSGGTGDADLYVKFGSAPTTSSYDCRPYQNGNAESCAIATPQAGTYHVMVRAYSTFSGVSLTGSFTEGGGSTGGTQSKTNLSVAQGAWNYTALSIPAGMGSLVVNMSGGSGDADLYIRQGSNPTTSTYACRSWTNGNTESCTITNPAAGTWNVGVNGYTAASGMNVDMEWKP
jgi:Zn-dependent metalloprotease